MELIGLLAIGIVIGIPVIAIVALLRSRAAERRIEESWYKVSDLQGDIAGLRRELARLSDRVTELESSTIAPHAEDRPVSHKAAPVETVVAPAVVEEVKAAPAQFSQPAATSSRRDQATAPLLSSAEAALAPPASFEAHKHPSHAGIAAFETLVQPEVVKEVVPTVVAASPRPAIPPAPAVPVSR